MANQPFQPSSHSTGTVDLTPVVGELRRIADLLEARLPSATVSASPGTNAVVSIKPGPAPIPLDSAGEKVFEALRAWRLERARKDGLSPYIVAYDRTLRQVAREKPASVEDLQKIQGFGPAKAGKYGPELLEVLAKAE
jgi:superfamily II DNA helicase RecQ